MINIEDSFKDNNTFSYYIENTANKNDMSVLETIMLYCSEYMVDPSELVPFINQSLKDKLEKEFINIRMLPKQPKLDF